MNLTFGISLWLFVPFVVNTVLVSPATLALIGFSFDAILAA